MTSHVASFGVIVCFPYFHIDITSSSIRRILSFHFRRSCADDMTFVLHTNAKHGPYLQELSLIRPIRMVRTIIVIYIYCSNLVILFLTISFICCLSVKISPAAFASGLETDPLTENACNLDWGVIEGTDVLETINCVGPTAVYGTGPFKLVSKETEDLGELKLKINPRDNSTVVHIHEFRCTPHE